MESPFRVMDEFDVFMDQVARTVSLRTLKEYALAPEQEGRQFIILTPQALDGVETNDQIRIHKMMEPSREGRGASRRSSRGGSSSSSL